MTGEEVPPSDFALGPAQLSHLLDHIDEVILTFDSVGTIRWASPGLSRLVGFDPVSIIGQSVFDFLHPDDVEAQLQRLDRWHGRSASVPGPVVRVRHARGGYEEVEVEACSGPDLEPVGGMALTLRAVPGGAADDVQRELRQRLINEGRLTRLASAFVHLPSSQVDEGVNSALREMGSLIGVDRAYVYEFDPSGAVAATHEWTAPDIPLVADERPPITDDLLPAWMRALRGLDEIHVPRVADLSDEWSAEKDFLVNAGVQSMLIVPMVDESRLLGFIGFESIREERTWEADHISVLQSSAGILAQAFARRDAERELARRARFDSITGLPNRTEFLERLQAALRHRAADGQPLAVLMLDLDRFNVVNDSLGHSAGDELLARVSQRLLDLLRPTDVLARHGGDEFAVMLTSLPDRAEALITAQRIHDSLRQSFWVGAQEVFVTTSIGIALAADDERDETAADLLRHADAAVHTAKLRGRNRFELFDESLREPLSMRLRTESDLRRAINDDEFTVHYQPEVALGTGELVGVEALVRRQHPDSARQTAADFIDLAEETGLVVDLGEKVLFEACRQLGSWRHVWPERPFLMRVNLSARQLADPGLVEMVTAAIDDSQVDPWALCLEMTETTLMRDAAASLEVLARLRAIGVELTVDDFGTGYSSLAYLKRFPVDGLKIDRTFVDGLGIDADDTAIVAAIMSLARALRLRVSAEGIETVQQAGSLLDLGCTRGQGFLYGPAGPARQVERWIDEGFKGSVAKIASGGPTS